MTTLTIISWTNSNASDATTQHLFLIPGGGAVAQEIPLPPTTSSLISIFLPTGAYEYIQILKGSPGDYSAITIHVDPRGTNTITPGTNLATPMGNPITLSFNVP